MRAPTSWSRQSANGTGRRVGRCGHPGGAGCRTHRVAGVDGARLPRLQVVPRHRRRWPGDAEGPGRSAVGICWSAPPAASPKTPQPTTCRSRTSSASAVRGWCRRAGSTTANGTRSPKARPRRRASCSASAPDAVEPSLLGSAMPVRFGKAAGKLRSTGISAINGGGSRPSPAAW